MKKSNVQIGKPCVNYLTQGGHPSSVLCYLHITRKEHPIFFERVCVCVKSCVACFWEVHVLNMSVRVKLLHKACQPKAKQAFMPYLKQSLKPRVWSSFMIVGHHSLWINTSNKPSIADHLHLNQSCKNREQPYGTTLRTTSLILALSPSTIGQMMLQLHLILVVRSSPHPNHPTIG